MTEYKTTIRQNKNGTYYARIHVFENNRKLWSHSTKIRRLTKMDAKKDAEWMIEDLELSNKLNPVEFNPFTETA